MAYCEHCGAYIPDGQKICLACGFDPDAEKKRAAEAQAAAYAYQSAAAEREAQEEDSVRAEVERRRAERQQNDRAWAENERRLRMMEERFKRDQEEKERRARSYVNKGGGRSADINIGDSIRIRRDGSGNVNVNIGDGVKVNVGDDAGAEERAWEAEESKRDPRVSVNIGGRRYTFGAEEPSEEDRVEWRRNAARTANRGIAAISYIGVLCFVSFFLGPDDEFVRFHARQGIKLFAYTILGTMLGSFVGIGWIAPLAAIGLGIKGLINALNGKMEELPLLRKLKWFR